MKFLNINFLVGICFFLNFVKNFLLLYVNFIFFIEIFFLLMVIILYMVFELLFKFIDLGLKYIVDLLLNICNLWLCLNKIKLVFLFLNNLEIVCLLFFVIGVKGCLLIGVDILLFLIL